MQYVKNGFFAPVGVDVGILVSAVLGAYVSIKLQGRLSSISNKEKNSFAPEFPETVN